MLDVKKLRVLQELSYRGTLSETADTLGYTPSAVSQQLAALERECGHKLLQKHGRGVSLTLKARTLIKHTEKILHELELAQTALEATEETPGGTVRLAIFQTAAMALLTPTLEALGPLIPISTSKSFNVSRRPRWNKPTCATSTWWLRSNIRTGRFVNSMSSILVHSTKIP